MENDYLVLAPHCIGRDSFLPFGSMQFSSQDYHIKQPQKILAYAKALQHWVEKAQLPMLGEPYQLGECMRTEGSNGATNDIHGCQSFGNIVPSNWVKITSSRTSEPIEPAASWE